MWYPGNKIILISLFVNCFVISNCNRIKTFFQNILQTLLSLIFTSKEQTITSTVAEHSTHNLDVKGSKPADKTERLSLASGDRNNFVPILKIRKTSLINQVPK